MPKYTIKQGYEHVVFSEQGIRRISANEVESDHVLNNPLLTLVKTEAAPAQQQPPAAPAQVPTAVTVPQINSEMQNLEEVRNKIENTEGAN